MLPHPDTHPEFYDSVAPKRLIAWIIDLALIVVIGAILTPLTAFTALFFFPLFVAIVGFVYRVVTLASGSATLGMRMMAIELRQNDGSKLEFISAFLHTLGLYISFSIPIIQIVSCVLMGTQKSGKGVTDLVLGTAMINKRF
jgi:uncharacterized RDD family membrane protein YckC